MIIFHIFSPLRTNNRNVEFPKLVTALTSAKFLDILLATGVGFFSFICYYRTLAPGLLPGDGGEFQTLAYFLGHTHPTNYPVYLVLGKVFTWLPIGTIPYRVNLLSAIMAGGTVVGVYLVGRLLTGRYWIAAAGALALAISPTFWSQAIIAEVYTAGAALITFILAALLGWDRSKRPALLFITGFLGGLSLGVHLSVALLAPAILIFLLTHWRRGRTMWQTAIFGALTGLLITIILFWLIDLNNPPMNYFDSVVEPSRSAWSLNSDKIDSPIDRLIFSWSAQQFHDSMFPETPKHIATSGADYWRNLPQELAWPIVWLATLGMLYIVVCRPRAGVLLLVTLAIQLLFFFNYDIWDLFVFFIPSYLLIALLSVVGMGALVDGGAWLLRSKKLNCAWLDLAAATLILIFAIWPSFSPRLRAIRQGEIHFDFKAYAGTYDYSQYTTDIVTEFPKNAIIFSDWELLYPYYYIAYVELNRTDLTFIGAFSIDKQENLPDSLIAYVEANSADHLLFFDKQFSNLSQAGYQFEVVQFGPAELYQAHSVELSNTQE